jgi:hypothetical protein
MTTSRLIAAALALPLLVQPARAADTLLQIVVDHSGVLHDEQDPQGKTAFNRFVERFLRAVAREHRRDRDDTRVILISAVEPPRILWSGNASDFYRDALESQAVARVITAQPTGCNNIPEALEEVTANLILEPAPHSVLHVVTSGVHSGPDCADLTQEDYVSLVETLDPDLLQALRSVGSRVDEAAVHFLTAPMRRALLTSDGWDETGIDIHAQGQEGF